MIDIHTHILPSLDDGARSVEEAVGMGKVALADGISALFATPHGLYLDSSYNLERIEVELKMLKAELDRNRVEIDLFPGLESYIAPDLVNQLGKGRAFCLNGGGYLLVELPMHQFPAYTEQALFEVQAKGFHPIIAHPERNQAIQENHGLLWRLVERDMLGQVTAASLLGAFGEATKRAAEAFVGQNLVHIIASDAHSAHGYRSPVLSSAVAAAARIVGQEQALAMVTSRPQAILDGQRIKVDPPIERVRRKLFAFWR